LRLVLLVLGSNNGAREAMTDGDVMIAVIGAALIVGIWIGRYVERKP
jgi:hypothetical protein